MKPFLVASLAINTPDGAFIAHYSVQGLAALEFPSGKSQRPVESLPVPAPVRKWHAVTVRGLRSVLAGRTPVELPPLDLASGTEFQRRVWEELSWTPLGEVRTYGEIARSVRRPGAAQAVGAACGANPVPLLLPCHRVLAANRRLGGFSGGLEWKRRLLEREGVAAAS